MTRSTLMAALSTTATLAFACGQGQQTVRPDEMSAEAHRQEAAKVSAQAEAEHRVADERLPPPNLSASGNPQGYFYDLQAYDPRNEHLVRARQLSEHAAQHAAAATSLEKFEEAECKQFPATVRASCPVLGPVVRITEVPTGVNVELAEGVRIDAMLAHMRCHLAFARTRGFESASSCPLYMKGIEIRPGRAARTIDIVSSDPSVAREIQGRTREEAILVERPAK